MFLKNGQGEITRLEWEPMEADAGDRGKSEKRSHQPVARDGGRLRALPAGTYTLTGYRVGREDDQGASWFISVILAHYDKHQITVRPGEISQIEIDPTVAVSCRANATGKFIVQAGLQGMHQAGLTIYRNGKRIPMGFSITAADGKLLESGGMNYG